MESMNVGWELELTERRKVMPRKRAPTFAAKAVVNEKFVNLSLESYRGKWLVLVRFEGCDGRSREEKDVADRPSSLVFLSV